MEAASKAGGILNENSPCCRSGPSRRRRSYRGHCKLAPSVRSAPGLAASGSRPAFSAKPQNLAPKTRIGRSRKRYGKIEPVQSLRQKPQRHLKGRAPGRGSGSARPEQGRLGKAPQNEKRAVAAATNARVTRRFETGAALGDQEYVRILITRKNTTHGVGKSKHCNITRRGLSETGSLTMGVA
jgi:hypothetical protein